MDFQISTRINKVYTCVPAPAGVPTLPCSFISFCLAKPAPKLLLKACRQCHRINIINPVAVASSLQNHREKKMMGEIGKHLEGIPFPNVENHENPHLTLMLIIQNPPGNHPRAATTDRMKTWFSRFFNTRIVAGHHLTWWQHFFFLVLVFFVLFKLLLTNGAVGSRSAPRSTI